MKVELKELEKEIEHHQQQDNSDPDDLFLPTMEGFVVKTASSFKRVEGKLSQLKEKFKAMLEYFGEETRDGQLFTSTDEFFGIFSTFLQSFSVRESNTLLYIPLISV